MNKGFIIDKNSDKIGEFYNAYPNNYGMWHIEKVSINKDYFDIGNRTTKSPYLFVLVEKSKIEDNSFDVIDTMGVGFIFSSFATSSFCNVNEVVVKQASFVGKGEKYEN